MEVNPDHGTGAGPLKEVVHPAPAHWTHHLEIGDPGDLDNDVTGWLREAADRAG